jgi:hypothetical protein
MHDEPDTDIGRLRTPAWVLPTLVLFAIGCAGLGIWLAARPDPIADPILAATLRLEPDGQSVAGLDDAGNVLWTRNIVVEFHIHSPIRHDRPISLRDLGDPHEWMTKLMKTRGHRSQFQSVSFHGTKEVGLIDLANGDYTSMGSD